MEAAGPLKKAEAVGRLRAAQRTVLKLFYDAGNKEWESFRTAVKEAAIKANRTGRRAGFSNATIAKCFRDFDAAG